MWTAGSVSHATSGEPLTYLAGHGATPLAPKGQQRNVLAYVDLLSDRSDAAYTRLLDESPVQFNAWQHIRCVNDALLEPGQAAALVPEVAARLRRLSQEHDNADLHLAMRTPFTVAVLLGRLLNTLQVTAYEWSPSLTPATNAQPQYVATLRLVPTDAQGPVSAVLMPATK